MNDFEQAAIQVPTTTGDDASCPVRSVLDRVGAKWTTLAISHLADGPLRFTELKRRIGRISQRMLTQVVRGLERDGVLLRTVYPTIPPRVEYALTPLGRSLFTSVRSLVTWALDHGSEIAVARAAYDQHHVDPSPRMSNNVGGG